MKRPTLFALSAMFSIAIFCSGCSKGNGGVAASPASGAIDADGKFEAMLAEIDGLIGKRASHMPMEVAISARYDITGPIDGVLSIVESFAANGGFEEMPSGAQEAASKAMPAGSVLKNSRSYTHANGDMLMLAHLEVSVVGTSSEILNIQLLSPSRAKQP